ncbi:hypothetical protein [Evansella clarkii]|uniref:hypothetical protein n=1 Tax=Evansella clarkii TaxID=79879 RepID=UPI000997D700|nr:hypothetical protein [Evansella clarkii]
MEKIVQCGELFEECCSQYMVIVHSLINKWKLFNDRDNYEQIGRIALYEAWQKYDEKKGEFAPFAKSYVSGRMKQAIYEQDRWGSRYAVTEPVVLAELAGAGMKEEERLIVEDWLERSGLSGKEKLWVREAVLNGNMPKDIAEIYGVNVNTVKDWRRRALGKLRRCCEDGRQPVQGDALI